MDDKIKKHARMADASQNLNVSLRKLGKALAVATAIKGLQFDIDQFADDLKQIRVLLDDFLEAYDQWCIIWGKSDEE